MEGNNNMGMKSKSGHFHIGNGSGGPSIRQGKLPFELNLQQFAKMPKQHSQVKHIMADRIGHPIDTPANRKILEKVSSNSSNYKGKDGHGNKVYSKVINGKEYWVYVRNGIIQNGGVNEPGNFKFHK